MIRHYILMLIVKCLPYVYRFYLALLSTENKLLFMEEMTALELEYCRSENETIRKTVQKMLDIDKKLYAKCINELYEK